MDMRNRSKGTRVAVTKVCFVLAILFALMTTAVYAGRGDKVGTAAAQELLIPVCAQSIALGGSSLATVTGIEAMYWNPAGLVRAAAKTNAMFSHMSYFSNIAVDYGAVSANVPDIASFGISLKSISVGNIPVTTADYPDGTGEIASPAFVVMSGAVSRFVTDHIACGISCNVIMENMEKVSSTGVAFSFGIQYIGLGGVDGLSLGATVDNVGPPMTYDGDGLLRQGQVDDVLRPETMYKIQAASNDLPSAINVGLGYRAAITEKEQLLLTTQFQNNNYSDDEYKFGAEFVYNRLLSLRAGYSLVSQSDYTDYVYGLSAGLGIAVRFQGMDISFDYAYRTARYFDGNQVLSLGIGF